MRELNKIILHSTATLEGKDYTIEDIRRWHKARGWDDIGYHFVIYRNGEVHKGRDVAIQGAHTLGHNEDSIGVAYVGGLSTDNKAKDTRTFMQKVSMRLLILYLKIRYRIREVLGHKQCSHTECPSFDSETYAKNIKWDIYLILAFILIIIKSLKAK